MLAALETSTRTCSVALFSLSRNERVAETILAEGSEGASLLLPTLRDLLSQEGMRAADLKALAVSLGPGSFTGIRVGIASAQGLSLPTKMPVFGVSSLDALAENLRYDGYVGEALCLMDAQRGECFVGHYRVTEEGTKALAEPMIFPPSKFQELLEGQAAVAGPGAIKYEKEIRESLGSMALFPGASSHQPRAFSLAKIAAERWRAGERPALSNLEPMYLRLAAPDEIKKK